MQKYAVIDYEKQVVIHASHGLLVQLILQIQLGRDTCRRPSKLASPFVISAVITYIVQMTSQNTSLGHSACYRTGNLWVKYQMT